MNAAADVITRAKIAMKAGDHAAALRTFGTVDLSDVEPLVAIRTLVNMSRCALALRRPDESAAYQRRGLEILAASGLLSPPMPDMQKLELMLAIGSGDAGRTRTLLPVLFPGQDIAPHDYRIAPVADATIWCNAHGIPLEMLDPPEHDPLAGEQHAPAARPAWHASIPDAEILAGWDFVIAATGEVLEGANHVPINSADLAVPHALNPQLGMVAHVWPPERSVIEEDVLFLVTSAGHHFGHWIAEFLPRLRAWDRKRKLAISAALPQKHRDLMACFGVKPDDLIACEMGRRYKFRSLQAVFAGTPSTPSRSNALFLYEALRPKVGRGKPSRKFFLVRDAGTRLPANAAELDAVLDEFGIEKINPARLSYAAQRELLADTGLIVGVFGTELYCMFNMPPGSTVIELIWDTQHATVYGPSCAFLGIDHHLVLCARAKDRGNAKYKFDGDLVVDCAALRERLLASLGLHEKSIQ